MTQPQPATRAIRWTVLALSALAGLAAGLFAAGPGGLVFVAALLGAVAVVAAWVALPAPLPRRRRRRRATVRMTDADFSSYRDIRGRVSWGAVGRRHFDTATRPLLYRLFAALAADRHRLDVAADPAAARRLLDPWMWELLDPGRPVTTDSDAPGVDAATLARIVDRLEEL